MRLVSAVAVAALCVSCGPALAQSSWLTVGEQAYRQLTRGRHPMTVIQRSAGPRTAERGPAEAVYVLRVRSADLPALARTLHTGLRHCGGMMYHASETQARLALTSLRGATGPRPPYTITQQALLVPMLATMNAQNIADSITGLSAFPDRFYTSAHGVKAAAWLAERWRGLVAGRPGASVSLLSHAGFPQPSVIATIEGSDPAAGIVVIGAHLDSINISPRQGALAPGADDDASGVASITEILRVLLAADGFKPRRTIKLIAYAAEEVGLRGSQEIASTYKQAAGVLQLDMVNYKGSSKDIYLISDYTDAGQNEFLRRLLAAYLPELTVGADRCAYACSDHASWHALGVPVSMPFEAEMARRNRAIHSERDTLANSDQQAVHALKFARLGLAFLVELSATDE